MMVIKNGKNGNGILVWDLRAMERTRNRMNNCASYLMFCATAVEQIKFPSGEEYYATTFNTIKDLIIEKAKMFLNIKSSLLGDELELEKAEEKSEEVINEIFHKYFYEGEDLREISFYNQLDYGDIAYAKNNVKKGGCGITCLAGMFTELLGVVVTPADLAGEYSGDKKNGGTSSKQMIQIANDYGFEVKKYGWQDAWKVGKVMEALNNGQQVILCVRHCAFTKGGHYIRLTGLTEDGKIIVHDPNGENWTKPNLKDGFENGFTPKFISQQGGGVFIFDKVEKSNESNDEITTLQQDDVAFKSQIARKSSEVKDNTEKTTSNGLQKVRECKKRK